MPDKSGVVSLTLTGTCFHAILGDMQGYIYFVGKPYPLPEAVETCHRLGYKAGLFLDKNLKNNKLDTYDAVIIVDFTSTESVKSSISAHNIQVEGLVCTYENYLVGKSVMAEHYDLPAPSIESARMCTDKFLMRRAFLDADQSITPQFGLVSSELELVEIAKKLTYPLILKPTSLVKSLLVLRCNNGTELIDNYRYAKKRIIELYKQYNIYDREPRLIIEEYITGKSCSIAAFIDDKGKPYFCEGIVALDTAQDISINDNYIYARNLPADYDQKLTRRLFETASTGIRALSMCSTPAHVEIIYNKHEVKLVEIGARIGGYRPRMYNSSFGLDLIEQEIRLSLGKKPNLDGKLKAYTGVYELFPESEGQYVSIEGAGNTNIYSYYSVKAKEKQLIGPAKYGYKAAAVIITTTKDKQEFLELRDQIDKIKIRTIK